MAYQLEMIKYFPKGPMREAISKEEEVLIEKYYNRRKKHILSHNQGVGNLDIKHSVLNKWDFKTLLYDLTSRVKKEFFENEEYRSFDNCDSYQTFFNRWILQEVNSAMNRSDNYWIKIKKQDFLDGKDVNPLSREELYDKKKMQVLKALIKKACETADYTHNNILPDWMWRGETKELNSDFVSSLAGYMRTHTTKHKKNWNPLEIKVAQAS